MENTYSIIELRDKFLKAYEEKPELFDGQDVERVLNNDFQEIGTISEIQHSFSFAII